MTDWIPTALKQKHPKLTLGIVTSVPWVITPDKIDSDLQTRPMSIVDTNVKVQEN